MFDNYLGLRIFSFFNKFHWFSSFVIINTRSRNIFEQFKPLFFILSCHFINFTLLDDIIWIWSTETGSFKKLSSVLPNRMFQTEHENKIKPSWTTSFLVVIFLSRKYWSFFWPITRRIATSSFGIGRRLSLLSNKSSTYAAITRGPVPSWSRDTLRANFTIKCQAKTENFECSRNIFSRNSRPSLSSVLKLEKSSDKTNWMAVKKLDFPEPFRPTTILCFFENVSQAVESRYERKPLIVTCLMYILAHLK